MAEDVGITIAVRGGRQAAAEAKQVSSAIGGIGHAAGGVAAAGVSKLGASVDRLGSSLLPIGGMMRSVRQHAFYLGAGIAGIGTLAVKSGLQFNASMEQNQVAFSHFLGSTQKAHDYLGRLYGLAAKTPFEFPQLTSAAQKFLAFGFSANEAYKTLNAVGDAAAGLGTGAEGIDRITLALGQMRAAGVVQGDELRQLQEAGINPYRYLERAGMITKGDIGQIGNMHLDANKAIRAITSGIEQDPTRGGFGGLAAAQGRTFAGQVSTLRDYTNQTLGTVTRPLFDQLEKRGLPAMTSFARRSSQIWKGDGPFGQKAQLTEQAFHHRFDPMIHAAERAVGRMHIGRWLSNQVEDETPKVLGAMGHLGTGALGAFARGWWHAGPYEKLFGALVVGGKLGVFSKLGRLALGAFAGGFGSGGGAGGILKRTPVPVFVVNQGGLPGGGGKGGRLGRIGRGIGTAGLADAAATAGVAALPFIGAAGAGYAAHLPRNATSGNPEGVRAHGPAAPRGSYGERHFHPRAAPMVRQGAFQPIPPLHLYIDGKPVAVSVHRHALDAQAARRGG